MFNEQGRHIPAKIAVNPALLRRTIFHAPAFLNVAPHRDLAAVVNRISGTRDRKSCASRHRSSLVPPALL
jgi:hypothetical protein